MVIAALYVLENGPYYGIDDVDPWPESRDARTYAGPHPVVAHPPCSRWCRLAGLVEKRWGHKKGEDDGCFEAALHAVRTYGGVLEHPAYSDAWDHFGLPKPSTKQGWTRSLFDPGASCYVEQGRYGHLAKKATWLYAVGTELPELDWGRAIPQAAVSWCGNREWAGADLPRIGKDAASRTPPAFQRVLLDLARTVDTSTTLG